MGQSLLILSPWPTGILWLKVGQCVYSTKLCFFTRPLKGYWTRFFENSLFPFFFETGLSIYPWMAWNIDQAGLKLPITLLLCPWLCLLCAEMTGVHHHIWSALSVIAAVSAWFWALNAAQRMLGKHCNEGLYSTYFILKENQIKNKVCRLVLSTWHKPRYV